MEKVGVLVGPGGVVDKNEQHHVGSKVLMGDNTGCISLVDISRKLSLDKF